MSKKKQRVIIQEQTQANERIIRSAERKQKGIAEGHAPANERIKQLQPNERAQIRPVPKRSKSK